MGRLRSEETEGRELNGSCLANKNQKTQKATPSPKRRTGNPLGKVRQEGVTGRAIVSNRAATEGEQEAEGQIARAARGKNTGMEWFSIT